MRTLCRHFGSPALTPSLAFQWSCLLDRRLHFKNSCHTMRKRPASQHGVVLKKSAVAEKCWSCVAAGLGENSGTPQKANKFRGCCRPCTTHRVCTCRVFNEACDLSWCKQCQQHPALWCRECVDADVLAKCLCKGCCAKSFGEASKADLCASGPDAVRAALERQSCYCRKRKKEHNRLKPKGEENTIRLCARIHVWQLGLGCVCGDN